MGWVWSVPTITLNFFRCHTYFFIFFLLFISSGRTEPQLWEWGKIGGGENVGFVGNLPLEWGKVSNNGNVEPDHKSHSWNPERGAKSLAFIDETEESQINDDIDNALRPLGPMKDDGDNDRKDDSDANVEKVTKKAKLNVSDKDSPYALIDKYFPERESYFYQNKNKFLAEYEEGQAKKTDIGNLDPSEVWLADSSLLVLKGGSTADRDGYDDLWEPLDDFQAPYREPVLPPPDFNPETLDIGVGVPMETIISQNEEGGKQLIENKNKSYPHSYTFVDPFKLSNNFDIITRKELTDKRLTKNFPRENDLEILRPYEDEVAKSQEEFQNFLNDVSKFISEMENFHSSRNNEITKNLIDIDNNSGPNPPNEKIIPLKQIQTVTFKPRKLEKKVSQPSRPEIKSSTTTADVKRNKDLSSLSFKGQSRQVAKQRKLFLETPKPNLTTKPPQPTQSYPLSYSSPFSKVYLSTPYQSNHQAGSTKLNEVTTLSPKPINRNQARSTITTVKTSTTKYLITSPLNTEQVSPRSNYEFPKTSVSKPTQDRNRKNIIRSRDHRVLNPSTQRPTLSVITTIQPQTAPALINTTIRQKTFYLRPQVPTTTPIFKPRSQVSNISVPVFKHNSDWRPVTTKSANNYFSSPPLDELSISNLEANYNPSPTPYSLFQSVPENINANDVFHLSQNVDFGKKLDKSSPLRYRPDNLHINEVDTGIRHNFHPVVSPHKHKLPTPRTSLQSKVTRSPVPVPFVPSIFGGNGRRRNLVPGRRKGRAKNTVRRRRPKQIIERGPQNVDRQGTGDVRYVSFFSGGAGGRQWGYSYQLGRK